MALRIDALGIVAVGMGGVEREARSERSACVVALCGQCLWLRVWAGKDSPEWIADD
jgi:hypothetical protein